MIESLMLLGIGHLCRMPPRAGVHSARAPARHAHHDAAPRGRDAARDKRGSSGQGPPARGIRDIGPAARSSVEEMRTRAAGQLGEIGRQKMEIQRLRLELDKKMALVFALRYRDKVRKSIVRRLAKLVFYAFIRSERRTRRGLFGMLQERSLAHARRAHLAGSQT
jgi:hypothetical protein